MVFGASLGPVVFPGCGMGPGSQLLQAVFTVPVVLGFGKPSKHRENVSLVPVQPEGTRGSLHLLLLGHNRPLSAELGGFQETGSCSVAPELVVGEQNSAHHGACGPD